MPAAATRLSALLAVAVLTCAAPRPVAAQPEASVRLITVGRSEAVVRVRLAEPGAVEVAWGEEPGAWSGTAASAGAAPEHELRLDHLAPDRRWFYEVRVDGTPLGVDVFRTNRPWVARQAVVQVTADAPDGAPGAQDLADRVFAEEADALLVLGADAGAVDALHARSTRDRLVLEGAPTSPLAVADLAVMAGASDEAPAGTCWLVALADRPDADVVVVRGAASAVTPGSPVRVTLSDAQDAGQARTWARVESRGGTLEVTLRDASGAVLGSATATKTCPVPAAPGASSHAASSPDGDGGDEPGTSDPELLDEDCPLP